MRSFLAQLAAIALDRKPAGAARPALPPRFAMAHPADPSPSEFAATVEVPSLPPPAHRGTRPSPPNHAPAPQIATDGAPSTLRSDPARTTIHRLAEPNEEPRGLRAVSESRLAPVPRPVPPAAPTIQAPRPPVRAATPQPVRAVGAEMPPAPIVLPTVRPSAGLAPVRSQPLSDAAVASLRMPRAEARPIIEVTIDRIDIRAPAAERPAPQAKRPRQRPAVDLADYLRGRGAAP